MDRLALCIGLLLFTIFLKIIASIDLEVTTPFGRLKGDDRGWYVAFEGIPYAEPPVGDRRFEPPVPFQSNVRKQIYIQKQFCVKLIEKFDLVERSS